MEDNNQALNIKNDTQQQSTNEINQTPISIKLEDKKDNTPKEQNISTKNEEKINLDIKDKNISENENKNKDSNKENSINKEEEKNKDIYIFNFDKDKINPCILENIDKQEESQIFNIFNNNKLSISINSDSLIIPKISSKKEIHSSLEIPIQSYEDNVLLSVSKNPSIGKISINDQNIDDFEKINRIYEKNKNVNLVVKNENDIICQKPTIIPENKENISITFQEMMNYKNSISEKGFTFDSKLLPKLNINNDNDIKDIFSMHNPIFIAYEKKNIKAFKMNKIDGKEKRIKLFLNEENEIDNTISANNERRKNKEKYTYKFQKEIIDNNRIKITNIDIGFFDKIEQFYEKSNIKSFEFQKNTKSQKLNIDNDLNEFITEIYCSYKPNIKKSPKIDLETNIFMEGKSIEDINMEYINKYIINIDSNNNNIYSEKNDIDVFDNIDFDTINKKYEKYKKSRTMKKDKYLYSGNASLQLIKDSLSQEIYNNSEASALHKLSIQLKDIDNINDNDEIKKIIYNSDNLALNNKNLKCGKKLKNELNRSLMNKYMNNNKAEIMFSYNPKMENNSFNNKDNNSINSNKSADNINKENIYYKKVIKKIKKINDSINEKEKKIYNNKLKIQQENKIEKEIKKETRYKYILPAVFLLALLFNKFYNIYVSK